MLDDTLGEVEPKVATAGREESPLGIELPAAGSPSVGVYAY